MATVKPTNRTEEAEKKFIELLRSFDNAMLVSHAAGDSMHARPMAVAETGDDGSIWFLTGADTTKTFEIARDTEVAAVMQSSAKYLSVTGTAELSRDRGHIHRLWKEAFKVWFDGKDDPNIVLIRLQPSAAEYWDNRGFQGLKLALRYAKAYITGEEPRGEAEDVKTHAKLQH